MLALPKESDHGKVRAGLVQIGLRVPHFEEATMTNGGDHGTSSADKGETKKDGTATVAKPPTSGSEATAKSSTDGKAS